MTERMASPGEVVLTGAPEGVAVAACEFSTDVWSKGAVGSAPENSQIVAAPVTLADGVIVMLVAAGIAVLGIPDVYHLSGRCIQGPGVSRLRVRVACVVGNTSRCRCIAEGGGPSDYQKIASSSGRDCTGRCRERCRSAGRHMNQGDLSPSGS